MTMKTRESRAWPHVRQMGAVTALIGAVIALAAGAPAAHAQGSIPAIRGVYQGTGTFSESTGATAPFDEVRITSQVNDTFGGQIPLAEPVIIIFLAGTVDSSGRLQGTYESAFTQGDASYTLAGTFTGQFDGSVIPKTLTLDGTGTDTIKTPDGTATVADTIMFQGALLTTSGQSADLSITGSASPAPVAAGKSITYNLTVANAGPNDATGTVAVNPAPIGASIVSATSSQGQCVTTPGNAACALGTLPNGGTATITITANVFAPGGSTLVDTPNVSSDIFDPNLSNNSTTIDTPVVGGAIIKLVWDEPTPSAGNPTPAPQNLRVALAGPPATAAASDQIVPQDTCTLIGINIYKSDFAPVMPIPANLWLAVPPANLQATLAVAPGGSFYVITNVWQCGGTIIESGVSNQASVPAGPTVSSLRVTGKLKGVGSDLADGVQVFVNGVGFIRQAVFADSTLVIQKGPLTDGTAITDLGTNGAVLVTFRNPDGGLGSITFKRP
jgi:uncharacterized repeat protein (TIGR01451 family)